MQVKEPKLAIPFSLYNEDDHLTVRAYKASIEKDASIFGYKIKSEDTVDDNNENDENDDENENNDSNKDDDEEEQDNNGANDAINEIFEVEKTVALVCINLQICYFIWKSFTYFENLSLFDSCVTN